MSYYSDPTANAALGKIQREMRIKEKRARHLIRRRRQGLLSPEAEAQARKEFTGIYRHLLDPLPPVAGSAR